MLQPRNYIRIVGILLFVYILSRVDFSQLTTLFREIHLSYYLAGLCLLIPAFLIRILKWKILVSGVGADIPFGSIAIVLAKGIFLGVLTPGRLGELWQAKYLNDMSGLPIGKGVYAVLMDRIIDIIVIVTIAIIASLSLSLFGLTKIVTVSIYVSSILVVVMIYFLLKGERIKKLVKSITGLFAPQPLKERIDSFLNEFFENFRTSNTKTFIKVLSCSFLYYFVAVLIYYFVALALKITVPFWFLFLIVSLIWLILMVPVTVLGLGTRETGLILLFSILGISSSEAVAFSLLILLSNIVSAVPGAILFLIT